MPRPRTPTAKARLTGADRKDPQRYAARSEPSLSGRALGKPPAYLPKTAKTAWATFADELPWLTYEDRGAVELVCLMRGRITDDPAGATAALFGQYRLALAALGATPVDRSKLNCRAPDDEADPFAQFDPAQAYFS
ncbi:hypothetical protein ACROSR_15815 [Roseovarius tibetensis]|uniref:hypothetical protein n=1 Tax=Roseovarius tibetensis TaxID=2685897 RepID=UPI003D7FBD7A